ncbi:MAG: UMP kinase [bacterium]|nr:UMP kinase [bacterium]
MGNYKEPPIIISVGGALIVPDGINHDFLCKLNVFIRDQVKKGRRFFLTAGGGRTARHYRDAGQAVVGDMDREDLDWLGIHATRLNGHLLRTIFQDIAHPRIIENYDKKLVGWKESVVIGAGWKPGFSTDYDAVMLAKDYKANLIINLSNIDWVYDKDPNKFKDAKPIEKMTWEEAEELVGDKWIPGMNSPFDPVATQLAKQLGLTVIVANGKDFENLQHIVEGDAFKGTVIMPYRLDASFYNREYYTGKKGEHRLGYAESSVGDFFHTVINYYRALLIKLFLNPKNCLDVGCGTGRLVKCLRFFGIDAHGVEISADALALADAEVKPFLKKGDITSIPYDANQFDVVITFDVLEHIETSKLKKGIDETIRVSKKYILHKIYTQENLWITWFHAKDYSHISVFMRKYWQKKFNEHPGAALLKGSFFKLPSFFESIFLLKKK